MSRKVIIQVQYEAEVPDDCWVDLNALREIVEDRFYHDHFGIEVAKIPFEEYRQGMPRREYRKYPVEEILFMSPKCNMVTEEPTKKTDNG